MAELQANKISFYKDGNWYATENENNITSLPYDIINLNTSSTSSTIKSAVGGSSNFDKAINEICNNKILVINDNSNNTSAHTIVPNEILASNAGNMTRITMGFLLINGINRTLVLLIIEHNTSNDTFTCVKEEKDLR